MTGVKGMAKSKNDWEQNEVVYAHIISKAWLNDKFRERLLKDTEKVLRQNGFELPDNVTVEIVEGAEAMEWSPRTGALKLPLPTRPGDLSDDEVFAIRATDRAATICCCCC
jgi:hypothetical protein